ncbi:MAG: hypothetical protein RIF32_15990 [Leptospirales bacterium]|jgi:hypothetical protein
MSARDPSDTGPDSTVAPEAPAAFASILGLAGCVCAGCIALIFAAPAFKSRPVFVASWLVALHLAWLLSLVLIRRSARGLSRSSGELRSFLERRPATWIVVCGAALVLGGFVFAPVYFSDDSVRHIHDGYYLLQGVDVYTIPPKSLPPVLARLPNHPDLGTIYLPFTQLQAVAGAAVHAKYGFLAIYYAVCLILIGVAWSRLRSGRERGIAALCLASPVFLIPLSARHADVQGLLLVCAALMLLRDAGAFHSDSRSFAPGCAAWAGALLTLAAGLKPEGALWMGAVGSYLLASAWFGRVAWKTVLAFASGCAVVGSAQSIFAWRVLFPTAESWNSFMRTVALFTQWFAAYNPILDLRESLHPGSPRPALLSAYRREVMLLATLWALLPMAGVLRSTGLAFLPGRLLIAVLAASIVSKGVWHPWYFLWILPALALTGRGRGAFFVAGALPLFYLPVVFLRATGEWWMPVFYAALGVYFLLWIGYIYFVDSGGQRSERV